MSERFDEFSKHLAQNHSRRGAFKFLGAGVVGAALSAIFSRTAAASGESKSITSAGASAAFNAQRGKIHPSSFNATFPIFNQTQGKVHPSFNATSK